MLRLLTRFISRAKQFSFGPECKEFESEFAKWQGRKHCVFFNSGSSANLALIQALLNTGRLKRGDHVGFSAVTWSTNVMPLIKLGLKAVPIDIELDTLNISSQELEKVLAKYPLKALFITHVLGFCHDLEKITAICKKKKIMLLEDTCESLGSVYKKQKLGNFGLASTFSFYVGHHLSTIEGGAICTDDEKLAVALHVVRAHGWDRNLAPHHQAKMRQDHSVDNHFYGLYTFYDLGYNLRPTEINAVLGKAQLKYADEIVKTRHENFLKLAQSIHQRTDLYYPLKYDHMDLVSNFAFPIICRTKKIQDKLITICSGRVEIRPIVGGNVTRHPFFKKYMNKFIPKDFRADIVHDYGLYFGNNPELSKAELNTLIKIFTSISV